MPGRAPGAGRAAAYLGYLGRKARYGGVPRLLVDGFGLLGVTVRPFYLHLEGAGLAPAPDFDASCAGYSAEFLGSGEMDALASLPDRRVSAQALRRRLEEGKGCLGVKAGGEVVAFSWFDLRECRFEEYAFPLGASEAYLFDAYTAPSIRGRGLAPFLRRRLYEELGALGRDRFYSVTDAFNVSARIFKERLGARPLRLGVHFELFGRARSTRIVKTYG